MPIAFLPLVQLNWLFVVLQWCSCLQEQHAEKKKWCDFWDISSSYATYSVAADIVLT
jgi:hypothetical protein